MGDLWIGLVFLAVASLAVFQGVRSLASRASPRVRLLGTIAAVTTLGLFLGVWQSPAMGWLLPFSNLIVVSNWVPLLAAATAALLTTDVAAAPWRRRSLAGLTLAAGCWTAIYPLLGAAPRCLDRRGPHGDFQQSTEFTCSAASAATFLRQHGIEATEREMAELCLTRHGTSWMGLYRGLKLKTRGTPWQVEIVSDRLQALQSLGRQPVLANVGMPRFPARDSIVDREENGWIPGVEHTVVLLGRGPGHTLRVADPTPGIDRELWRAETFHALWRGVGFRLVQRGDPALAMISKRFE